MLPLPMRCIEIVCKMKNVIGGKVRVGILKKKPNNFKKRLKTFEMFYV